MAALAEHVCALCKTLAPDLPERVMYGGIMFGEQPDVMGVFAYTEHVSVEFARGAELADPAGVLEGLGRSRRHIKLHRPEDVEAKQLRDYIQRALSRSE